MRRMVINGRELTFKEKEEIFESMRGLRGLRGIQGLDANRWSTRKSDEKREIAARFSDDIRNRWWLRREMIKTASAQEWPDVCMRDGCDAKLGPENVACDTLDNKTLVWLCIPCYLEMRDVKRFAKNFDEIPKEVY